LNDFDFLLTLTIVNHNETPRLLGSRVKYAPHCRFQSAWRDWCCNGGLLCGLLTY